MKKFLITLLAILLVSCSSATDDTNVSSETVDSSSTSTTEATTTTTTTTTVYIEEPWAVDEFGIELLEMSPNMKAQFEELMSFVERRVGLEFTEFPLFNLYTVNGYQEYNAVSYLDDFDEDYEEGEWERAVLSENMWGLTTATPDQMKNLITEFQRCASAGSYNLLDKILRVPIKKGQDKLNLWEQSVIVHELTHSLQGQHFQVSEWYQEMKELDDFSAYPGIRALMEAQADYVQIKWEDGLDNYDRTTMNSQVPNISCRVQLPGYFYIPNDLYYSFGPQLVREILNKDKMTGLNEALYRYKNEGLDSLPTAEQVYDSEKFFTNERYDDVSISTLEIENYQLIDEGTLGSLDIVYVLQDFIGRVESTTAAVGLGGGSWKDYVDSNGNLVMSVKISGDTAQDLKEIYDAYIHWANVQDRFDEVVDFSGGKLYKGKTNVWISTDGSFVRLFLSQDISIIESQANNLNSY
jgi:hypothetical protein